MKLRILRTFMLLIYVLIAAQFVCAQEGAAPVTGSDEVLAVEAAARQMRIYRDALLQGSSEEIRVDAAVSLLLQNSAESRNTLLTALKSDENPLARNAVCKALVKSRALSQTIDSIDVFQEPLLLILQNQSGQQAQLAAEALLLFDYNKISENLMQIALSQELEAKQRINAIYALQLRSEPSALRSLIQLLDDPDTEVAKAAETALQEAFGIPVGTSRKVWSDILIELQLKSPQEIRKERLLRQETKLREVQTERDRWQKLYLSSLDKQHDSLADEAEQTKMVLELMGSDLYPIRQWALSKAAAKYPDIGEELKEKLFALLLDTSRDVRLQTAKALMNMSALNPAEILITQFEQEKDLEVRLAMFEALGEAVFFAFLPNSKIELPTEIKTQTLIFASDYLQSELSEPAIKGAEVIRKILELNSLSQESIQGYLDLLNARYRKSLTENGTLRADLLAILAHLCGQGGVKTAACALFEPLFIDAIVVKDNPALRLAAAQGLTYTDKIKALELFKQYNLMQDESLAVQQVVVDLAGQTGAAADLAWLIQSLSNNGHGEQAWNAIKSICQRQKSAFLMDWLKTLKSAPGTKDEYTREILDIAEQKAIGEKNNEVLAAVQRQKILWFLDQRDWESGTAYLEKIDYPKESKSFNEEIHLAAMQICLGSQAREKIVQIFENKLLTEDLDTSKPEWQLLDEYFVNPNVSDDAKRALVESFVSVTAENRPQWSRYLDEISEKYSVADPNSVSPPSATAVLTGS